MKNFKNVFLLMKIFGLIFSLISLILMLMNFVEPISSTLISIFCMLSSLSYLINFLKGKDVMSLIHGIIWVINAIIWHSIIGK